MNLSDYGVHTLDDAWQHFRKTALHRFPLKTHDQLKAVFYAGAGFMFDLFMAATEPEDEEQCLKNMDALDREIKAFTLELADKAAKGRA